MEGEQSPPRGLRGALSQPVRRAPRWVYSQAQHWARCWPSATLVGPQAPECDPHPVRGPRPAGPQRPLDTGPAPPQRKPAAPGSGTSRSAPPPGCQRSLPPRAADSRPGARHSHAGGGAAEWADSGPRAPDSRLGPGMRLRRARGPPSSLRGRQLEPPFRLTGEGGAAGDPAIMQELSLMGDAQPSWGTSPACNVAQPG